MIRINLFVLYVYIYVYTYRISVVLGYQPQQLLGQVCYEYFHPEDIKKMVELLHTGIYTHTQRILHFCTELYMYIGQSYLCCCIGKYV